MKNQKLTLHKDKENRLYLCDHSTVIIDPENSAISLIETARDFNLMITEWSHVIPTANLNPANLIEIASVIIDPETDDGDSVLFKPAMLKDLGPEVRKYILNWH
jgi:hypothetical protein